MNGSSCPPIKKEKGVTDAPNDSSVNPESERQVTAQNGQGAKANENQPPLINPSGYSHYLAEVAKQNYQDFTIKVFTDQSKNSGCFFFEPIVLLDQKSITIQSQKLFQEDVVCFSIQMWNQDIRSKVLERLRLKNFKFEEDDVTVMPYEEVQLTYKSESIHQSIKMMEEVIPYHRLNEKIDFYLLCDSPTTAKTLADNLRNYPGFVVRKWQLALECRGLALNPSITGDKTLPIDRPLSKLMVATLSASESDQDPSLTKETVVLPPSVTDFDKQIKELQAQIQALANQVKNAVSVSHYDKQMKGLEAQIKALNQRQNAASVPVFSVIECTNPSASSKETLTFASSEIDIKTEYGEFDLKTGIFTVKKSGIFLFNFTGLVQVVKGKRVHHFELMVDGIWKSMSYVNLTTSEGFQPVILSTFQNLVSGQKVSVRLIAGELNDGPKTRGSRFSCVFFS